MTVSVPVETICNQCESELPQNHIGPCPKCGNSSKRLALRLTDSPAFHDSVNVRMAFYYDLNERCYLGGKLVNSSKIELVPDKIDQNYLKAFIVKTQALDDKSVKEADEQASRLTNFLGVITGTIVGHKRPRVLRFQSGATSHAISYAASVILAKKQDLDLLKLSSLLDTDSRLNQHLLQANKGLKALLNNDFAEAIKAFYLVIEKASLPESEHYLSLRDGLSHQQIDRQKTLQGLAAFGFSITKGGHLDQNDPDVQEILAKEAENMRISVWKFLESELAQIGLQ